MNAPLRAVNLALGTLQDDPIAASTPVDARLRAAMMTEMNFIVVEMRDVFRSERRERFGEYMMLALYHSSELEGTSQGPARVVCLERMQ